MPKKKKTAPTEKRAPAPIKPLELNYVTRSNAGDSVIGLLQAAGTAEALRKQGAPEARQIQAFYARLPREKKGEVREVDYTPDDGVLSFLRSVGVNRGGDLCREYIKTEIRDVRDIAGYNVGVEKVFDYLITEARLQCFDERTKELTATGFIIDLQDLVRRGIYSRLSDSQEKFREIMRRLAKVGYSAQIIYATASGGFVEEIKLMPIFGLVDKDGVIKTYDLLTDNRAIVYINELGPFSFFCEQLTLLPDYAGGLSEGAYKLVKEIFRRASLTAQRRHIGAAGYIEIKLTDAADSMSLPISTKNPLRDRLQPIRSAAAEINSNEAARQHQNADKLRLYLEVFENGGEKTADILKYGVLRATFAGDYRDYLSRER